MNLAWKDIRSQGLRFLFTGLGLGLLFAIVLAMGGIYRGMVADATMLVDAVGADLWVTSRTRSASGSWGCPGPETAAPTSPSLPVARWGWPTAR